MNPKREPYNKAATTAKPDCRMTAERNKPTPPPRRVPDEIERKIFDSEYAHDVTLRQLYGDLSFDQIMLIPKFKRDNRILFGLMKIYEFRMNNEERGETHQGMIDKFLHQGIVHNCLMDFPLIRLYEEYRKICPAASANDNAAILATLEKVKVAAERAEDRAEETKSLVKAHLTPRPADYQVTQDQLSGMLSARNCPRDKRTIIRWEKYLSGDLKQGTKPPEGYTLQTRLTLQSVNAFLDFFCSNEKSKLNTRISYDALTSGRRSRK